MASLRCNLKVFRYSFQRPYRYFSIALKVILYISDLKFSIAVIDYLIKTLEMTQIILK